MVDTASAIVLLTVAAVILLLVSASWYVRRKARGLSEREFHVWFQRAFLGMTRSEVTELSERKVQKRQAGVQS